MSMRPASRGGPAVGMGRGSGPVAAYAGSFAGRPATPSQSGGPGPIAGRPVGTAVGSVRPGSGFKRLGTAGPGAAPPGAAVGLHTEVNVAHRPATQQGLQAMPTKPLGPGRQIADKSYYYNELRQKLTELNSETTRMKEEQAKAVRDNASYATLERKYEAVHKDLRSLEGQLADFNLAVDKVRTNTSPHEIQDLFERLHSRNDYERKQVDEVFMRTQMNHKQERDIERRIQEIHQKANERLLTLGEELAQEYQDLTDEHQALLHAISQKQQDIRELDQRINRHNAELKSPEYQIHSKGMQLSKRRKQLASEKSDLEEEVNSSLSPAEMRDRLLQKVKDANAEVTAAEKKQKQLSEAHDKLQDEIREREQDIVEAKKHAQKAKKYEALFERDRKMQEFIDKYPETKRSEQVGRQRSQDIIVALLKHISKHVDSQANLPSADKLAEMKSELTFKEKKMQNSKDTLGHLSKELDKRKEELEKIINLDKKINNELGQLKEKIRSMNAEMTTFKSEEQLQEEANAAKKQLLREKVETKKQRDAIKWQVQVLSGAYEKRKRETLNNDVVKRLDSLEQKLRVHSQTVYKLADYISTHRRESDYEGVSKEVNDITKDINIWAQAQVNAK